MTNDASERLTASLAEIRTWMNEPLDDLKVSYVDAIMHIRTLLYIVDVLLLRPMPSVAATPPDYRAARGALAGLTGEPAEASIRRLRDATPPDADAWRIILDKHIADQQAEADTVKRMNARRVDRADAHLKYQAIVDLLEQIKRDIEAQQRGHAR